MNSKVYICVEETAGICKDHGHNPVITAATKKKRPINGIFCLGNGALAIVSCL